MEVPRLKLPCMKLFLALLILIVLAAEPVVAQSAATPDGAGVGVALIKLFDPIYPGLAQQARIAGDVDLVLSIRKDGSVGSVTLVSGHPMLIPAARDSARRSEFECRGCADASTQYALKYRFQIAPRDPPKDCENQSENPPPPEIDLSRHQITVFSWELWTCDPAAKIVRVHFRAGKCLYLWRCGVREVD